MCVRRVGVSRQVFSAWRWREVSPKSAGKGVGQGRAPHGAWDTGATGLPFPSALPAEMAGVRPPPLLLHPSPYPRNWIISTSSLKLILDFPSLGGENEAES